MNQCLTCERASNPKTRAALFFCALLTLPALHCLDRSAAEGLIDGPAPAWTTEAVFYRWDLLNPGVIRTHADVPYDRAGIPDSLSTRPDFVERGSETCVLARPAPFQLRERGVRISYCIPGHSSRELQGAAARIQSEQSETAPVELRHHTLRIGLERLSELSGISWEFALLCGPGLDGAVKAGRVKSAFSCQPASSSGALLTPSTFPGIAFGLLIRADRLLFIYPGARSTHVLAVEILDDGFRARLLRGLALLPQYLSTLHAEAKPGPLRATEAVGPDVFPAPYHDGFVEVAHDQPGPVRDLIRLESEGRVAEFELLVLENAVALLPFPAGKTGSVVSGSSGAAPGTGGGFAYVRQTATRARQRTVDLEHENRPSASCAFGLPCGSPGVHPSIDRAWQSARTLPPPCLLSDFSITEFNPFGLSWLPDLAPDASGKFIELIVGRACVSDSIVFLAGKSVIEPGRLILDKGQVLLFVADSAWFSASATATDSTIAQLSTRDSVGVRSVASDTERTLRESPPENTHYLPTSPARSLETRILHSLQAGDCGHTGCEFFSRAEGAGLRPELRSFHAMDPGVALASEAPKSPQLPEPGPVVRHTLSELLPTGARSSDGASLPNEEFIEVHSDGGERGGLIRFTVAADNSPPSTYNFVPPRQAGYFALARDGSKCFADTTTAWGALSLPNKATTYTIEDSGGNRDSVRIEQSRFLQLDGAVRRSLTRVDSATWAAADGPQAEVSACLATRAGPGKFTGYAPFVRERHFAHEPTFQFFSPAPDAGSAEAICDGQPPQSIPLVPGNSLWPNSEFTVPLPFTTDSRRCLLTVRGADSGTLFVGDFLLQPGLLYFDSVYATPRTGEFEFVRVCSVSGFRLADQGLLFSDRLSTDRIVTYEARHQSTLPGSVSSSRSELQPGECALILDPDAVALPEYDQRDVTVWTTETGSALGDGLAAGEGLLLREQTGGRTIASFGLPDSAGPWTPAPATGEISRRLPGTYNDRADHFVILPFGAPL